ncbi:pilus assembly protein TadG-related protein [Nocardiopsis sp. CT-R113]|uniref:Pilus assembly protein TadG-related protein n=1 Tax=Nocardiopsis codii TaxID=3065942 RepID=A0ABU7K9N2_9ACTN|nr:pilus assembly protein TadG-related protein [Nocardiopsis sp. CT-R113]MEE2038927.1 pilus assembly protein TadG-related protein [Nocardiopsis sp. CT-R113]
MTRVDPVRHHRRNRARRSDDGHASVFLIMLIPVIAVVFALVVEAGQALVAKSELLTVAHSAARVGAHQVDPAATLGEGAPVLDPDGARQAATDHLHEAGMSGQVSVVGERVVVLARTAYTPNLLPIGEQQIEVQASAAALQPSPR